MGALQKQQKNSYLADIKRLISNCKISGNFDQCESQLEEYTKKYKHLDIKTLEEVKEDGK